MRRINPGRRAPENFDHVQKHRLQITPVGTAERSLKLPAWHPTHDQGREGSCVGHGVAMERAILNTRQNVLSNLPWPQVRRYNPIQIWNKAKEIDPWSDTNPGDDEGTSVAAGYDAMRLYGAQRVKGMKLNSAGVPEPVFPLTGAYPVDLAEGIVANRWATHVDEIRAAIQGGSPVTIGVNWYDRFWPEFLVKKVISPSNKVEWWLPNFVGNLAGGHCVCLYAVSDRKQAFRIKNSWGKDYPEVWIRYDLMQRLLNEDGEAAIVTDR